MSGRKTRRPPAPAPQRTHQSPTLEVEQALHTVTCRVGPPTYGGTWQAQSPAQAEVPFVIEGELIRMDVPTNPVRRSLPAGALLEVLEPAADRVVPRCQHFGECGGCQYQHLSQAAQLRTKAAVLDGLLQRAGLHLPPTRVEAAEPWGYRNRVRFRVQEGRLGYSRRASHTFLAIVECPILAPILWRAAQATEALHMWPAGTTEIEFLTTGDESAVQILLHIDADLATLDRNAPATFRALCEDLRRQIPELAGGGLLVQAAAVQPASRRVQERQRIEVARWGAAGMIYTVGLRSYAVSRGAFFQVNRFLTERLVELVTGARRGGLALDLFAGSGLFSLPLAERFQRVVSVEIGEPAASDLQRTMAGQKTLKQTTLAFLRDWNRSSAVPDLVVIDPPRAGAGDAVIDELRRLAPPEIVYVSCDPVSFAREARSLVDSGYAVEELHALDLFPQTFHMEIVAIFRRN